MIRLRTGKPNISLDSIPAMISLQFASRNCSVRGIRAFRIAENTSILRYWSKNLLTWLECIRLADQLASISLIWFLEEGSTYEFAIRTYPYSNAWWYKELSRRFVVSVSASQLIPGHAQCLSPNKEMILPKLWGCLDYFAMWLSLGNGHNVLCAYLWVVPLQCMFSWWCSSRVSHTC